ncbi:MAG TPA: peptidoglycan-binding domain-containing protein [Saprospiraceae bacterium]|nr:peptidoglycan-binding domain-containing protein [Saprospiraceae bacterium]HMP23737.1 peptidoglycan-binding domain-containing protein [Saprospiraceae bacterium]
MNSFLRKRSLILLFTMLLGFSSCHLLTARVAPLVISTVIVIGKELKPHVIAAFVEQAIDKGFHFLFKKAAQNTADAVSDSIVPIDGQGLFGRKVDNPQYKVMGNHQNGEINHTIFVEKELVLFQRKNKFSKWTLTPDSEYLIAERLEVASAQVSLHKYGYNPGSVDGKLGKNTAREIRKFQKANSLPVTGQLDDVTREYLLRRH